MNRGFLAQASAVISFPLSAGQPCWWCNSLLIPCKQFQQIRRWTPQQVRHTRILFQYSCFIMFVVYFVQQGNTAVTWLRLLWFRLLTDGKCKSFFSFVFAFTHFVVGFSILKSLFPPLAVLGLMLRAGKLTSLYHAGLFSLINTFTGKHLAHQQVIPLWSFYVYKLTHMWMTFNHTYRISQKDKAEGFTGSYKARSEDNLL